jgi:hypothetical protein
MPECELFLREKLSAAGPSYTVPRLSVAQRDARAGDISSNGFRDRRFSWDYAGVPVLVRNERDSMEPARNRGLWLVD